MPSKPVTLSTKILSLGIVITLCFIVLLGWLYPKVKDSLYNAKYTKTRHLGENAYRKFPPSDIKTYVISP